MDLEASVKKFAKNNLLIISFGNWDFRDYALNWAAHLRELGIDNYLIIATDKELAHFLTSRGINSFYIGNERTFNPLQFNARFRAIRDLLSLGITLLHSDLDAIWIKNPLQYIDSQYDMVASMVSAGNPHPWLTAERWGFTFCMGWMLYKSNEKTLDLFEKCVKFSENSDNKCDQFAFNNYLSTKNPKAPVTHIERDIVEMNLEGLKIKILGQSIIARTVQFEEGACVVHPPLGPIKRKQILKSIKLWKL